MSLEDTARETNVTPCSGKLLQKKCYRSRQNTILLHTVRIIKTIKLGATPFSTKYSFQGVPNQVEKLRKFQGVEVLKQKWTL